MTRLEGPKETLARKWPHVLKTLDEGRVYIVEIKRWYKPRSLNQNSLFHAIVSRICREDGDDLEMLKEGIKERFKVPIRQLVGEEVVEIPKPSHLCDTAEMNKYIDGAMLVAAERGIDTTEYHYDIETLRRGGEDEPRPAKGEIDAT